ncbi:MAG: ATP-binding protein [Sorangiineae bacterium]|nr:ATP-binding protein [Polyangiaceae bacterium]MEB2320911.1 ATP-binding protein [Sorangiineae bacterium]
MDLRTRTSLFCGVLALAIAVSILLRGRARRSQLYLAAFAADIGLWYLAQWLYHFVRADVWAHFTAVLAVLLPQFALRLFDAVVPEPGRRSKLLSIASALMVPMLVVVMLPQHMHALVRGSVFLYVFGLLTGGLWSVALRGERSRSRATQRRVRFLVLIGALAGVFSLADFLWFIGAPLPPVGQVLSIVFLFVLAESMTRERLVDVYDILGQLLVSTALAFALAGIFYVFVVMIGGFSTMYLNAVLAAIVIMVLFEPLREKVEEYIHRAFFRERVDLERAVGKARRELGHTLEVEQMLQLVVSALESSRRATGAALFLREPLGVDFELGSSFGPVAPSRVDGATARPLLERLAASSSVALEEIIYELGERRRTGWTAEAEADERLLGAAELLGAFKDGVCLAVHGEGQELLGFLVVVDDRVRDAFSEEDISLLESLAVQIGVVIENSRQYRRLQERDRLAALGQMAAGLAHEVKNPLGAIKGAAQLLSEPEGAAALEPGAAEFVSIILEEVDRLDRVVGSVLDYARPSKGNPGATDVNGVVRRTLQVLASDRVEEYSVDAELSAELPLVRADAEQLRQVLINLVRNAVQAMNGSGRVLVSTRARPGRVVGAALMTPDWVELSVRDDGPGIAPQVLKSLFVPFFTTKDKGTGLGLAISQRMVEAMGGRIEVASQPGAGSTFTVVLPAVGDLVPSPRPPPASAEPATASALPKPV